eukprot:gnl/MRDRNA2_/MRDRNA2_93337_c0_seq1.p1 gnl/MRDRNA2_/MRDRNA2_93337_c0~~gnl/MRDRNA2_/MRDRNA2_93337_c0_seq1.p1  ORF type:complete len:251 (+),score=67.00 gnl/MRDRNA2_/MRDRNA2_93337_c0_seq1:113-865(+)
MGKAGGNLKHLHKRRVHLERHQPAARQRLGLLEKHKDYVQRARNFHKKEDTIRKLHEKAYFKNPDEFAHAMINKKIVDGRMRNKDPKALTNEEEKLLESQDQKYIGMRRQIDVKAAAKKASNLHFLGSAKPESHTIFLDDDDLDGGKLEDVDAAKVLDTHPDLVASTANRPRLSQLKTMQLDTETDVSRDTHRSYRDLLHVKERSKKLTRVLNHLDLRQNLKTKGKRRKVTASKKDGPDTQYKWMRERKR